MMDFPILDVNPVVFAKTMNSGFLSHEYRRNDFRLRRFLGTLE